MLEAGFLQQVVEAIINGDVLTGFDGLWVEAIGLTGSYARGTASPYSDVDIRVYVAEENTPAHEHYQLRRFEGHLVSISVATITDQQADLLRPESGLYVALGLRQMQILHDPQGKLAEVKQAAAEYDWTTQQKAAEAFASKQLCGYAEEAHKLLGGLSKNEESTQLYATYSMVLGITNTVVVARGVLIESENVEFQAAQDAMGKDSEWTRQFRLAAGFDVIPAVSPARMRAIAGLALYAATVELLRGIIPADYLDVIEQALAHIESFTKAESQALTAKH